MLILALTGAREEKAREAARARRRARSKWVDEPSRSKGRAKGAIRRLRPIGHG